MGKMKCFALVIGSKRYIITFPCMRVLQIKNTPFQLFRQAQVGAFRCKQQGFYIMNSRVGDGIIDCFDGCDEYDYCDVEGI